MAEFLSPWEIAAYDARQSQARTQYENALAGTEYQRRQLGLRNQRDRDRLGYSWDNALSRLPYSFVGRGLMKSGIYKQALEDYANQRLRSEGDLQFDYNDRGGALNLQDQGYGQTYNNTSVGIAAEREARRAQLATIIRDNL